MTYRNTTTVPLTFAWPVVANQYNSMGQPKHNAVYSAIIVPAGSLFTFDFNAGASGPYIKSLLDANPFMQFVSDD